MSDILTIFQSEVANVKDAVGILPACVYGPLPTTMTSHFTKNGGNALGITAADGPLVSKYSQESLVSPSTKPAISQCMLANSLPRSNTNRLLLVQRRRRHTHHECRT
jgi:hypothetical protein